MPTLRQLRDRVKSLKNTQQITRAMKMVAGARIRRAEQAMKAARPYASALSDMLVELSAAGGSLDHPLLRRRDVKRHGVLLMTADKGLCGAFNSNLVRAALQSAATPPGAGSGAATDSGATTASGAETALYLVGLKGRVQLRRAPYAIAESWPLAGKPFAELAKEVAEKLSAAFLSGEVDAVTLVSSRFVSTIVQRPTAMQLLPVQRPEKGGASAGGASAAPTDMGASAGGASAAPARGPKNAFEFEPDPPAVLAALLPKYFEFTIYQALLETQASEFAARLIAMTNATDNAGKLIDELTLVMNKTRQAAITKEILEIVGGAEALQS